MISRNAIPVTKSDTVDLPGASTGGLYVGTGGTLTVTMLGGATVQLTVPVGWIPIAVTRVWLTGTAAANISALIL